MHEVFDLACFYIAMHVTADVGSFITATATVNVNITTEMHDLVPTSKYVT